MVQGIIMDLSSGPYYFVLSCDRKLYVAESELYMYVFVY